MSELSEFIWLIKAPGWPERVFKDEDSIVAWIVEEGFSSEEIDIWRLLIQEAVEFKITNPEPPRLYCPEKMPNEIP